MSSNVSMLLNAFDLKLPANLHDIHNFAPLGNSLKSP